MCVPGQKRDCWGRHRAPHSTVLSLLATPVLCRPMGELAWPMHSLFLPSWAWGPPSTPKQPRDHRQLMHGDTEERLLAWGLAELGWSTRRPLGEVAVCGLEMRHLVPSAKIQ